MMKLAAIQMTSGADIGDNLAAAEAMIRNAAAEGATLIATPEVTDLVAASPADRLEKAFTQDAHPGIALFSGLARELSVDLLIGSMVIKTEAEKLANRSFFFAQDGTLAGTYDKIHLFDVDLPGGESYRESDHYAAGSGRTLVKTDACALGMSICYDLRFPYLYRSYARDGADILAVPALFTVPTGRAHWHVLLRARAIETGCFVLAPAQIGDHGSRQSYGHSLIISPWGEILAERTDETPGILVSEINPDAVAAARSAIPSLSHDRDLS